MIYNYYMIAYLKGFVLYKDNDFIIINVNNVGYRIFYSHISKLKINEEVSIYTHQHVREDEISLYGFESIEEYKLFEKLISVKGLGCKTALNILKINTVSSIINAINDANIAFIKAIPGIGSKTASQIILDLQGKLVEKEESLDNEVCKDTKDALKALGYKPNEINNAIKAIDFNSISVNDAIRLALNKLRK